MANNKSTVSACLKKVSFWVELTDNSMDAPICPCFPKGTRIGIDTDQTTLIDGKFYLFQLSDVERLKKVLIKENKIYLEVLNPELADAMRLTISLEDIAKGDVLVIGRGVIAQSAELYPEETIK